MNKTQQPWIEKGYQTFAEVGPLGLSIEPLARKVGKNKSSFYHHFADLEVFTKVLLDYHLNQATLIAEKEAKCTSLEELITILVEHKTDLLFNRQLRIYRSQIDFKLCFEKTSQITAQAILPFWSELLDLQNQSYLAELVLKLSLENFYLQITDKTLNPVWLNNYFQELRTLTRAFKNS